ncbi:Tmem63b [Symbiodinium sp. KB8]|nr:Tmem63b [Symbiodinium sp. KB8]
MTILGLGILLPIYIAVGDGVDAGGDPVEGFAVTTVQNLEEESDVFWATAIMAAVFTVLILAMYYINRRRIRRYRKEEDSRAAFGKAVLVNHIEENAGEDTVKRFVESLGLGRVSVLRIRNKGKLLDAYGDWRKASDSLERGLIHHGIPQKQAEIEASVPTIDLESPNHEPQGVESGPGGSGNQGIDITHGDDLIRVRGSHLSQAADSGHHAENTRDAENTQGPQQNGNRNDATKGHDDDATDRNDFGVTQPMNLRLLRHFKEPPREMTDRAIIMFPTAAAARAFRFLLNRRRKQIVKGDDTGLANAVGVKKWTSRMAPDPRAINWVQLCQKEKGRALKSALVNIGLIIFILIFTTPTSLLTALDEQSSDSFGSGVSETWTDVVEWVRDLSPVIGNFILKYLPTLLLIIMNALILLIIKVSNRKFNPLISVAEQENAIMGLAFGYLFFNTVIVPTLALSSAYAFVQSVIEDKDLLTALGELFLADSGILFMGFLLQAALLGGALLLLRLPQYVLNCCRGPRAMTSLDFQKMEEFKAFEFGPKYAITLNAYSVVLVFSVMIPLILPVGALFLLLRVAVEKFNYWYALHELYVLPPEQQHASPRPFSPPLLPGGRDANNKSSRSAHSVQEDSKAGPAEEGEDNLKRTQSNKDREALPFQGAGRGAEEHSPTKEAGDAAGATPMGKGVGLTLGRSVEHATPQPQSGEAHAPPTTREVVEAAREGRAPPNFQEALQYQQFPLEPSFRGAALRKGLKIITAILIIFQVT